MKVKKTFRSAVIFTFVILAVFIGGGLAISKYTATLSNKDPSNRISILVAKLIHQLSDNRLIETFHRLEQMEEYGQFRFELYDASGNRIYPTGGVTIPNWELVEIPQKPFDVLMLERPDPENERMQKKLVLVRMPGKPIQFLATLEDGTDSGPSGILITIILVLLGSIFLGVGIALFFIFRIIQRKLIVVDDFMLRLKRGDLKARIKVDKQDEIGLVMSRYNQMADEIEFLVENLRKTEQARVVLLQELAHDLRTPIASLKSLTETLQSSCHTLPKETVSEIFELSLSEITYFQRLVEDLLFLSRMSDPLYRIQVEKVDLNEVIESATDKYSHAQSKIKITFEPDYNQPFELDQGDRHLLRRLFKNAISNAVSFARSEVKISLSKEGDHFKIHITDDGPGFHPDDLLAFGERRITRIADEKHSGRVSIGLGSVIMKTIVDLHRGTLTPSNITEPDGTTSGAQIEIVLNF